MREHETHIDDPVLWVVSVGATYVQTVVGHGLDHPDVVAAVILLGRERKRVLESMDGELSSQLLFLLL